MELLLVPGYRTVKLEDPVRKVVLTELIFPIVLLILGIYLGLMQFLYRAGWIRAASFIGIDYYQGLTAHGVINAIVFTTFFAVAFGTVIVRYYLDKPVPALPAQISMWMMVVGTVLAAYTILSGQASVLYTFYPPLKAHPLFYSGLALTIVGSWVAFFNWIPLYLAWRRERPGEKTPLAVVGIFSTFIVWLMATLPVAVEVLGLLLPWSLGIASTVDVTIARTLFWFFGHPLVYFWILPAYIMYYVMLPRIAGGKLFSDFAGRVAFLWFIVFSAPLGLHHQFTDPGISSSWKFFQGTLTFLVAIPSFMTAFIISASMEHGARSRGGSGLFGWWSKLPYFDSDRWLFSYFIGGLLLFIFGGITGIVNSSYNMNRVVHNTAWLPAHFHMTVAGPVFLAFTGMTLYLTSQLLGKPVRLRPLHVWAPWLWTLGVYISSAGAFAGGLLGMPRRTNLGLTYLNPASSAFQKEWVTSGNIAAFGGIIMTLAALFYFAVFFATVFSDRVREPVVGFPTSDVVHDENVSWVRNLAPWVIAGVVACLIAYAIPLYDLIKATAPAVRSPPYDPNSPVPLGGR